MLEIVIASIAVVGVCATGSGLILTWRRNGTNQVQRDIAQAEAQAVRDAELTVNQQAIIQRLDDKESGLQAVNIKVGGLITHFAVLDERVIGHDREITDLKRKR